MHKYNILQVVVVAATRISRKLAHDRHTLRHILLLLLFKCSSGTIHNADRTQLVNIQRVYYIIPLILRRRRYNMGSTIKSNIIIIIICNVLIITSVDHNRQILLYTYRRTRFRVRYFRTVLQMKVVQIIIFLRIFFLLLYLGTYNTYYNIMPFVKFVITATLVYRDTLVLTFILTHIIIDFLLEYKPIFGLSRHII